MKLFIGLILGLIIGFVLFAATPLGNRYYFLKTGKEEDLSLYKADTWTGRAWFCFFTDRELHGCIELTTKNLDLK